MISIIVCYRNREEHLKVFVPYIKNFFGSFYPDQKLEIIIVEQSDTHRFKRGTLLNEGAKLASGDILVFHDVDYLPSMQSTTKTDVTYFKDNVDIYQPIKRVNFINMDSSLRDINDVPVGYRHFKDSVDDDFFGGVITFTKSAFDIINGFNPMYDGWGLEDADLRERINFYKLTTERGNGTFLALPHSDSFPGINDDGFKHNQQVFSKWKDYLEFGKNTQFPTLNINYDKAKHIGVDIWAEATNFTVVSKEMEPYMTLENVCTFYEDDPEIHTKIWNNFKILVNATGVKRTQKLGGYK